MKYKGPYTQIVFGSTFGFLMGFVTMKVGKLGAIALGSSLIILEIAHIEGLVNLDWSAIPKLFENSRSQILDKSSLVDQARDFALSNVVFTVAFVGGTFIGIGLS